METGYSFCGGLGSIYASMPAYPLLLSKPWNASSFLHNFDQNTQNLCVEQLNSRILELQMQQCCCNQISDLNNRLSAMVNAAPIQCFSSCQKKDKKDFVYELDKVLFPDNPIRDYIAEEVRKIKEKYANRIKLLNSLVV